MKDGLATKDGPGHEGRAGESRQEHGSPIALCGTRAARPVAPHSSGRAGQGSSPARSLGYLKQSHHTQEHLSARPVRSVVAAGTQPRASAFAGPGTSVRCQQCSNGW